MPKKLDLLERVEVTSRAEWRSWLKKNHERKEGIGLVTWKKAHHNEHVGYDAIVEEALCFGWIDSLPRKLDERRSMLYVSPRKPKSVWSKLNKERVAKLIAAKRMSASGLGTISTAKSNGSWTAIDEVEALIIPHDLAQALDREKAARQHFNDFPPGSRKNILQWIANAKTEATRAKRIAESVALAAKNIRANQYRP